MVIVQPEELLGIEGGAALRDPCQVELGDQLLGCECLPALACRPAEEGKVVHHRLGEVSLLAVLSEGGRTVALAETAAVGSEDNGDVGEERNFLAEGLEDHEVAGGVRDVIVPADDVGDPHGGIVDDDGEVVGREAVALEDDKVAELVVLESDDVADEVLPRCLPVRDDEAHCRRNPFLPKCVLLGFGESAAPAVVPEGATGDLGLLPPGGELLSGAEAGVGLARGDEAVEFGPVDLLPLRLEVRAGLALLIRPFIPIEPQPAEGIEDAAHRFQRGTLLVGVFYAQHKSPAVTAGEEVVEERCPGAPDVEMPRRTGGEPHPHRALDGRHAYCWSGLGK